MAEQFSQMKSSDSSPMKKLGGLSPERFGSTAHKNPSYTPEKLQNNYMYKEVTITKKIEAQKNKIRELESQKSLLEDNIRHLTQENSMMKVGYEQQIEMYKRMLREQEEEAKRLLGNLRSEYTVQIEKILFKHQEDSKVAQAEKQELQMKIQNLLAKIDELEGNLHHGGNAINQLTSKLSITSQKLIDTEDKALKTQNQGKQNIERLNRELTSLNNKLIQQNTSFKQQLDALNNDRIRQVDALKRLHLTDLDKMEARRDAQINVKNLEMRDIKNTFEAEARRLEEIINNKDRVNQALGGELKKEREKAIALTRNYDIEVGRLINEKDRILSDFAIVSDQKNLMGKELTQINILFDAERGRNALSAYNATTINRTLELERSEEVKRLMLEVRNLKDILQQSSREMERCKEEFLRMELERERLIRANQEREAEAVRLKAIVAEQDIQLRLRLI